MRKKLSAEELHNVAIDFRTAIMSAKRAGRFSWQDRMHNFPGGCCDDACDLLAHYLNVNYGIESVQRNGVYRDDNEYNTTNHVWLLVYGEIIIDLTVSQLPFGVDIPNGLYFGTENLHYRNIEDTRTQTNYNITNDARLLNDYSIIMEYMP
ncbi:MAG: hypothetical protein J6A88_00480 [Oscillospiraceae bacterium]|nr:hypothetical protein [Oscillospiraceae bacterium]